MRTISKFFKNSISTLYIIHTLIHILWFNIELLQCLLNLPDDFEISKIIITHDPKVCNIKM
jgi:hypothetical protein